MTLVMIFLLVVTSVNLDLNFLNASNREINFLIGFYNNIVDSSSYNKSFRFSIKK